MWIPGSLNELTFLDIVVSEGGFNIVVRGGEGALRRNVTQKTRRPRKKRRLRGCSKCNNNQLEN